uniref:C-type lectin domain-containing protein n=1 Tax=Erpetoichthys calabaricus TaxID=27687 RepID=A0A8C4STY0_ERPCA
MGVLLFCLGYLYPSKNLKGKKKTQQRERTFSTWEEAMDYCRERNSNLISISSQVEQDAIAALVNTTNSTNVWLGLRQSRLFGFWFWIDEKPLSYEKWVHGPPSQLPCFYYYLLLHKQLLPIFYSVVEPGLRCHLKKRYISECE